MKRSPTAWDQTKTTCCTGITTKSKESCGEAECARCLASDADRFLQLFISRIKGK